MATYFQGEGLLSRRAVMAGAGAVATAPFFAAPAHAATTLRVGKSVSESIGFTPVDIGSKHGIFQTLGINPEITGFGGGAKMHQALAAGGLDIAIGSGPDLPFIVKGEPARAVSVIVDAPAYLLVLARADGSIKTIADLKGKTVNVASLASMTGWLGAKLWQSQGWAASDLKFTVGPPTTGLALLRSGQADAMITDGTFALKAEEEGNGKIIYNCGALAPVFHTHMIFASDALIASNPDAIRAFLKGWYQTIAFMKADRARMIADIVDVLGLDTNVATKSVDAFTPIFRTDGRFSPAAMAVLSKSFVEVGALTGEPADLGKLYTEAYLPG